MSISTDSKFLSSISVYLPLFKWSRGDNANCRCILCGDSKKDATKARGFFFPDEDHTSLQYKCHNCGESMSFSWFLKTQFPEDYKEYRLEKFRERGSRRAVKQNPIPIIAPAPKAPEKAVSRSHDWTCVDDLPDAHPAKSYLLGRMLTSQHLKRVYYTTNFRKWCIDNLGEVDMLPPSDPRIIFPFMDESGRLFGAQGRIFGDCSKNDRFKIAMKKGNEQGKIFGLETVNKSLPVLLVEGAIDSLFLPNCIAVCGGDINKSLLSLSDVVVAILDNEPRSRDTIKRMEKAIDAGFRVVIWSVDSKYKDINDMVMNAGMPVRDILKAIASGAVSGSAAKIKLTFWKRV